MLFTKGEPGVKRLLWLLVLLLPLQIFANGEAGQARTTPTRSTSGHASLSAHHGKNYCYSCPRDKHGRIVRSFKARKKFMILTGFPHGRKGFVVDHIKPLKKGGCDCPENMQWQTRAEAKAKDRWE